uniref:TGF_BETA_2 domain-containing protein n=1 Tax=Macrostomum lignano TaxID=282301 RepID=A0A1I8JI04_9PLAT
FEQVLASDTERELKQQECPGAHYCGQLNDITQLLNMIGLPNEKIGIDNGMPLRARINNFQLKIEKCNNNNNNNNKLRPRVDVGRHRSRLRARERSSSVSCAGSGQYASARMRSRRRRSICNDRYKIHVARVVGGVSFANPLTQLPCGCAI